MATSDNSTTLSYPQVRAQLAQTLVNRYAREQIVYRLRLVGYDGPLDDTLSNRSLAYKLAWRLLPACPTSLRDARRKVE